MPRTLYAWQDKESLKYYLSAFPPLAQGLLDDEDFAKQITEAAKYRPAVEFSKIDDLYTEIARRKGAGRVPAVTLKWDEGSSPNDA